MVEDIENIEIELALYDNSPDGLRAVVTYITQVWHMTPKRATTSIAKIQAGQINNIFATEWECLVGPTTNIQSQMNGKASSLPTTAPLRNEMAFGYIAFGDNCLSSTSLTDTDNTVYGVEAWRYVTTGKDNTALGHYSRKGG